MKKVNLIITPYSEQNPARRKELETCYRNNLQAGFDDIYLVVEKKDEDYAFRLMQNLDLGNSTVHLKVVGNTRPAFQEYINLANTYEDSRIFMVCNSDIFIEPADLEKIKNLNWSNKLFVALSRHDLHEGGASTLLERADAQDCWIWTNKCDVVNALCPIGYPGSDNAVCWKFYEAGYKVINPSKDIKIMHLHNVLGNNYREGIGGPVIATQICPPPYHFVLPSTLNQI